MEFDPEPYATPQRERNRERYRCALSEAERIAERIMDADPSVRRVVLFGSLAFGVPRNPGFDIDLALDGGDEYVAMDAVADSPFRVDVVRLDRLPEHVRRRVGESGRVLRRL